MNKEIITNKWLKFKEIPFPEINDVNLQFELTTIDSYSAGCISRYLDGELDQECISFLKQSSLDLEEFLKKISGKEKVYFMLLHELVNDIKTLKNF